MTENEQSADDTKRPPHCDWCGNKIQRLNGNVDKNLCATCLGKGKCGWAPDKDNPLYADTDRSRGDSQ